jgi:hypothetical protein
MLMPGKAGAKSVNCAVGSGLAGKGLAGAGELAEIVKGWSSVLYAFSRINPKTSVTLRLDFTICVWLREITWLPASRCCAKPASHGIRVGGDGRVMLVVILGGKGMRGVRVPIQIGHRLMSQEQCSPRNLGIFRKRGNRSLLEGVSGIASYLLWRAPIGPARSLICRRNQVLAVGEFVIEQCIGDWIDPARIVCTGATNSGAEIWVHR